MNAIFHSIANVKWNRQWNKPITGSIAAAPFGLSQLPTNSDGL